MFSTTAGCFTFPEGWKHEVGLGVDSTVGKWRDPRGDLAIQYEIGSGLGADPEIKTDPESEDGRPYYKWFREEIIQGEKAYVALTHGGWLFVSFPRGRLTFYLHERNADDEELLLSIMRTRRA